MELNYDWHAFQSLFYPKRRSTAQNKREFTGAVHVIVEDHLIVCAFAEGEDFSEWPGASYQDIAAENPHRELLIFQRRDIDQCLSESLSQPHFYDQIELIRSKVTPLSISKGGSKTRAGVKFHHSQSFLLEAFKGWWAKILPSAYGIFIRLEENANKDLFLLIRRGKLELFQEPDLSSLGNERGRQPTDVVKYLSEKYLVPVQGIFAPMQDWKEWDESAFPWRKIALAIRSNRAKLVPFRWGVVSMVATRGFLGF